MMSMRFFVSRFFGFCDLFQEQLLGHCDNNHGDNRHANNKQVSIQFDPNEATKSEQIQNNCHRGHPHIGLHILP